MSNKTDFDTINAGTSFADGDRFNTEQQVREYFTIENLESMFNYCAFHQYTLDEWADAVILNKWHCNF